MAEPESTQQKGAFVTHPIQAETPRRSPLRRKIIGAAFLIIVLWFMTIGMRWRASLASAVKSADRVLISTRYTSVGEELKNPIEVIGADAAAELLDLISIERFGTLAGYVASCKCLPNIQIEFRHGSTKLARIGIGHGEHLRWLDRSFSCYVTLTSKSGKAITKWWADHLPPVPQWKSTLHQAVASADRLVISVPGKINHATVEIRDTKTIQEFLNAIEVDEQRTIPNTQCGCIGDVEVAFYRGDIREERLWVVRDKLKWLRGQWSGDMVVTQQSRSSLETWLKDRANFVIPQSQVSRDP